MSNTRRHAFILSPITTRGMNKDKENIGSTRNKNRITTYSTSNKNVNIKTSRTILADIQNKEKENVTKGKLNIASVKSNSISKSSSTLKPKKSLVLRAAIGNNEKETVTKMKIKVVNEKVDSIRKPSTTSKPKTSLDLYKIKSSTGAVPKKSTAKRSISVEKETKAHTKSKNTTYSLYTISPIETPVVEVSPRKSEILASIPTVYNQTMKTRPKKFSKLGTICEDDSLIIPNEEDIKRNVQFKRGCGNTNDTTFTNLDDSLENLKEIMNITFIRGEYTHLSDNEDNMFIEE